MPPDPPRRLVVLGSTGSVGVQTLETVDHLNALADAGRSPLRFEVAALAAGRNARLLAEQARRYSVPRVALADTDCDFDGPSPLRGPDAAERLVRETDADLVVAAMVGVAGLPATLAAVQLGRGVALANKETLVSAGPIILAAARRTGARILPLDSEHAGAWQTLRAHVEPGLAPPFDTPPRVRRLILTASGGAFRDRTLDQVYNATPEQALEHPNWSMGAKVTVDSATMINKGLELIEAHHLFGLGNDRLGVIIQRQSVVHAIAEITDGALIAHLSATDMRHPIQAALTHPLTLEALPAARLDIDALTRLDFQQPDPERFPAIGLARRVVRHADTTLGAIMNAANEAAVEAFLARKIPFGRITELTRDAMESIPHATLSSLSSANRADAEAREFVRARIPS